MIYDPNTLPFWETGRCGPCAKILRAHERAANLERMQELKEQLVVVKGRLADCRASSKGRYPFALTRAKARQSELLAEIKALRDEMRD